LKNITSIIPLEDFQLLVKFDNGIEKRFDFKPYLQFPVFTFLKDKNIFRKVTNRGYFIEWQEQEVDLSADTLWHKGK
jgi:hypothetical protein